VFHIVDNDFRDPRSSMAQATSRFPDRVDNRSAGPSLHLSVEERIVSVEERIVEVVRFRQIRIMQYDLWH
jgi:hypothetical protein